MTFHLSNERIEHWEEYFETKRDFIDSLYLQGFTQEEIIAFFTADELEEFKDEIEALYQIKITAISE